MYKHGCIHIIERMKKSEKVSSCEKCEFLSWVRCHTPVIPGIQEAEAGGS
jgi:hypothetical protein